ncbi:hypothetical protein QUA13_19080 [Microcoleus sp. S28C3]
MVETPKATGKHSEVAGFTVQKIGIEIERLNLPTSSQKNASSNPCTRGNASY